MVAPVKLGNNHTSYKYSTSYNLNIHNKSIRNIVFLNNSFRPTTKGNNRNFSFCTPFFTLSENEPINELDIADDNTYIRYEY